MLHMRPLARVLVLSAVVACSAGEHGPASDSAEPLLAESDRHHEADVLGVPARRPSGERVVARRGSEPGESDLYVESTDGRSRPLAPAPGPDELPIALPDGRIAFVSGRTSVASLFVVDPETGALRQLTNRGLVAGRAWQGFVPPPAREARFEAGALVYDDGSGEIWRVDLTTGDARSLGRGGAR